MFKTLTQDTDDTFELPPNAQGQEDVIGQMRQHFASVSVDKVVTLKHHAATWSVSANRWFAENIVAQMTALKTLDLSHIQANSRSDIALSVEAILTAVTAVESIDLSDNILGTDGAKTFVSLLASNRTLVSFRANNCGLGSESAQMIFMAIEANMNSKLASVELKNNEFGSEGKCLLQSLK